MGDEAARQEAPDLVKREFEMLTQRNLTRRMRILEACDGIFQEFCNSVKYLFFFARWIILAFGVTDDGNREDIEEFIKKYSGGK